MLIDNPPGGYRFLTGISPFSSGVVADAGHEIVHATLDAHVPWRQGFEQIDAHLAAVGRGRTALCAIELRCPTPYSMPDFIEFNKGYVELVRSWDLYVGDHNPLARTNVAPAHGPPAEPVLHAFSYTVEASADTPTTFATALAARTSLRRCRPVRRTAESGTRRSSPAAVRRTMASPATAMPASIGADSA